MPNAVPDDAVEPSADPDTGPNTSEKKSSGTSDLDRRALREALNSVENLRAKPLLKAMHKAESTEAALAAVASKAAQMGEQIALGKMASTTVPKARLRLRHIVAIVSFFIFVVGITAAVTYYLYERAAPQFASTVAFSVRSEDHTSPTDALSGFLGGISNSQTSDTDILYDFLLSQDVVVAIRDYRDLEGIWARPGVDWETGDPVFAYAEGGTIEDLTSHWRRKVQVAYDTSARILEVQVLAFTPEDAQNIANDVLNESTRIINSLSSIARRDVLAFAQEDLESAEEQLRQARQQLTTFRNETQIASMESDIDLSTGPLNILTQKLAEARIELGEMERSLTSTDPRIAQLNTRISVIEDQIQRERAQLGGAQGERALLAERIAEFERLSVNLEFAEGVYQTALSAFFSARAEANRQTLYLAAHKRPTLAERAEYPNKLKYIGLTFMLVFAIWAVTTLTFFSLRDRR